MESLKERKPRTPRTPKDESPGCQNNVVVKIKDIDVSHSDRKGRPRFIVKGRLKPRPMVYKNVKNDAKEGVHLKAILFDKTSTIQIVAFDGMANKYNTELQNNDLSQAVISIEKFRVSKIKDDYKTPDHKFQINLGKDTVIRVVNNEENSSDFPKNIFIKGTDFETLESGMSIDVVGKICDHKGEGYQTIKVDSTELKLQFSSNEKYKEGTALCIYNALFTILESQYTLRVTRYSYVQTVSDDEYIRLSQYVDGSSEKLSAQRPSTSRSSNLSNLSHGEKMDYICMKLNNMNVADKDSTILRMLDLVRNK